MVEVEKKDLVRYASRLKVQTVAQAVPKTGAVEYGTSKMDQPHDVETRDPL